MIYVYFKETLVQGNQCQLSPIYLLHQLSFIINLKYLHILQHSSTISKEARFFVISAFDSTAIQFSHIAFLR